MKTCMFLHKGKMKQRQQKLNFWSEWKLWKPFGQQNDWEKHCYVWAVFFSDILLTKGIWFNLISCLGPVFPHIQSHIASSRKKVKINAFNFKVKCISYNFSLFSLHPIDSPPTLTYSFVLLTSLFRQGRNF